MKRLSDMTTREIEDGAARYYERLGAWRGEDAEECDCNSRDRWCDQCGYDPDDEIIAEPDERLQPWEVIE